MHALHFLPRRSARRRKPRRRTAPEQRASAWLRRAPRAGRPRRRPCRRRRARRRPPSGRRARPRRRRPTTSTCASTWTRWTPSRRRARPPSARIANAGLPGLPGSWFRAAGTTRTLVAMTGFHYLRCLGWRAVCGCMESSAARSPPPGPRLGCSIISACAAASLCFTLCLFQSLLVFDLTRTFACHSADGTGVNTFRTLPA